MSYWGAGRTREITERSLKHSLCFGVYAAGNQVAFARVVSGRAVIGYVCDVFVLPAHQGKGVGAALMQAVIAHPDVKDLQVLFLNTRDAHGLYERFGFRRIERPENMMCRLNTNTASEG